MARPFRLTEAQRQELRDAALRVRYVTCWHGPAPRRPSTKELVDFIAARFGVAYTTRGMTKLLNSLGLTCCGGWWYDEQGD